MSTPVLLSASVIVWAAAVASRSTVPAPASMLPTTILPAVDSNCTSVSSVVMLVAVMFPAVLVSMNSPVKSTEFALITLSSNTYAAPVTLLMFSVAMSVSSQLSSATSSAPASAPTAVPPVMFRTSVEMSVVPSVVSVIVVSAFSVTYSLPPAIGVVRLPDSTIEPLSIEIQLSLSVVSTRLPSATVTTPVALIVTYSSASRPAASLIVTVVGSMLIQPPELIPLALPVVSATKTVPSALTFTLPVPPAVVITPSNAVPAPPKVTLRPPVTVTSPFTAVTVDDAAAVPISTSWPPSKSTVPVPDTLTLLRMSRSLTAPCASSSTLSSAASMPTTPVTVIVPVERISTLPFITVSAAVIVSAPASSR